MPGGEGVSQVVETRRRSTGDAQPDGCGQAPEVRVDHSGPVGGSPVGDEDRIAGVIALGVSAPGRVVDERQEPCRRGWMQRDQPIRIGLVRMNTQNMAAVVDAADGQGEGLTGADSCRGHQRDHGLHRHRDSYLAIQGRARGDQPVEIVLAVDERRASAAAGRVGHQPGRNHRNVRDDGMDERGERAQGAEFARPPQGRRARRSPRPPQHVLDGERAGALVLVEPVAEALQDSFGGDHLVAQGTPLGQIVAQVLAHRGHGTRPNGTTSSCSESRSVRA